MKLIELLTPWVSDLKQDCDVTGLKNNSRAVETGDLFIAYPGAIVDGRDFISQAVDAGASAVLYEAQDAKVTVTQLGAAIGVPLSDLEAKLAVIASRFYGEPGQSLCFTGVTGTNGKTTIAYQLAQAYSLLNQSAAYIGTLGEGKPFALRPLNNTTPDALVLQSLFHDYVKQEVQQVCMEVSSHALSQHRVDHIAYNQAIFTNLTHDHLDYHKTMQAYAEAKALLFKTPSLRHAILNQDDPSAQLMQQQVPPTCEVFTYGIHEGADVQATAWKVTMQGTEIAVRSPWGAATLHISALGFFNLYNALAIFTSLLAAGFALSKVVAVMSQLKPAPGRMEVVRQSPTVIVDYAHTPDALENVLSTLNQVKEGRLLAVFGCGGDRDRLKRPIMAKIGSQYADLVFLTSDNPRHEDPEQILADLIKGIPDCQSYEKITDREAAIQRALGLAEKNDIVLIAGKGHESYQQIGDERLVFSDQEVVKRYQR